MDWNIERFEYLGISKRCMSYAQKFNGKMFVDNGLMHSFYVYIPDGTNSIPRTAHKRMMQRKLKKRED